MSSVLTIHSRTTSCLTSPTLAKGGGGILIDDCNSCNDDDDGDDDGGGESYTFKNLNTSTNGCCHTYHAMWRIVTLIIVIDVVCVMY